MADYGVTGARVDLETTVDMPPERLWELITAVHRIGEWSPECEEGSWLGDDARSRGRGCASRAATAGRGGSGR